jgi:hypothetical protein
MTPIALPRRHGIDLPRPPGGGCGCSRPRCWRHGAAVRIATLLLPQHPAWGFVRAFAEAAMVGGLAGLVRGHRAVPAPARAADPAHRDHPAQQGPHRRHARQLPEGQFPHPRVVARRMRSIDVASAAGRFLANPSETGRMRGGASALFAKCSSRSTRHGSGAW